MILLFNLSTVYVVSLSAVSSMAIDIMFALAVSQFILIITYHMIVYTMRDTFKRKVYEFAKNMMKARPFSCFKLFVQWIMRRCNLTSPDNVQH